MMEQLARIRYETPLVLRDIGWRLGRGDREIPVEIDGFTFMTLLDVWER
jgi:hypothetical protein